MDPQKPVPLYEMFPNIKNSSRLVSDFSGARVVSAYTNSAGTNMEIVIVVKEPVPPFEASIIEDIISNERGIKNVDVSIIYEDFRTHVVNNHTVSHKEAGKKQESSHHTPSSSAAISHSSDSSSPFSRLPSP